MARFLTPLRAEEIEPPRRHWYSPFPVRAEWRLIEPLVVESDVAGMTITVPAGTPSDGASVPRWPFIWLFFDAGMTKAAWTHDYLFRVIPAVVDFEMANLVYQELNAIEGRMGLVTQALHYAAVSSPVGRAIWNRHRMERPILYVPDMGRDLAP